MSVKDSSYTEAIPVLRGHLEEIYEALHVALGYQAAIDLVDQYRNVGGVSRPSNLARKLEKAANKTEGYLEIEEEYGLSEE